MSSDPNATYAKPLWIGGGITWDALEEVEQIIRLAADQQGYPRNDPVRMELRNLANAAAAELTKRPKAVCDLI